MIAVLAVVVMATAAGRAAERRDRGRTRAATARVPDAGIAWVP